MPRKGENIYRRQDGRWEARYIHHYEGGKARYRYVYGTTYLEVREKKQSAQAKVNGHGEPYAPGIGMRLTFSVLAEMWLSDIRVAVKESTYTRYHRIVSKYLIPRVGGQVLSRMDNKHFRHFPELLLAEGGICHGPLAPKTVTDILCVLKSILRYGKDNDYPCPDASCLKSPQTVPKNVKILSDETRMRMEQILLESDDTTSIGIFFTLFTGVRIGELCGLRWGDINFGNRTASISRTVERIADLDPISDHKTKVVIGAPKTRGSVRVIPLPDFLLQYLKKHQLESDRYLLTGDCSYTEPHQYYVRYRKFLKRNGIDHYTFHALRHTFATRCVEIGFDTRSLSEILGHTNITTTLSIYVHPTLQQKKIQMERLTPENAQA